MTQNPQSSQKLAKDFSKYISSTYHIYLSIPLPRRRFASASAFTATPTATEDANGVFLFSRLLDSVPDWGRHAGSKGAPKQPKKSKKTYPKHAHHCQGFRLHRLRSVSSRAVIRQCFDKLPATPSQNFLGLSPQISGETYQKGSKIIKNIQKIIGRWKNGKVQSSCSKQ